jgi:hypothetical protein
LNYPEVSGVGLSFDGIGGASALAAIAFSVVFLVLGGLTLVIYAMRYASGPRKK